MSICLKNKTFFTNRLDKAFQTIYNVFSKLNKGGDKMKKTETKYGSCAIIRRRETLICLLQAARESAEKSKNALTHCRGAPFCAICV